MTNIIKACFLIFSLSVSTISFAANLTEESVRSAMAKIDNAVVNLNAKEVSKALSDSVTITMNINVQGKTQVMKPSKEQYITMLKQGWSMYTNYKYSRSNVKIKIKGGKAYVTADVKESMTVQGQHVAGESKEEVTYELINGKPLITSVVGYTTM